MSYGEFNFLDVQPVLDKLHELSKQHGAWITPSLILYPSGDGAVVLEDMLHNKRIAVVDFDLDSGDTMLEAVDRLAIKAREALTS